MTDELRRCFKCGYETTEKLRRCPTCGRALLSTKTVRRLGWVQLAAGLFLVVFVGMITFYLAPDLLGIGVSKAGTRFTGTPEQGRATVGLFGLVIVFGFASTFNGILQIKTGRRNKFMLYFILALIAVIVVWLFHVQQLLGG